MVPNPNVKKIVISGYYGFGNSGDEAVLHSILLALKEEGKKHDIAIDPVVLSIDPESTERMHGVKAVHRLKLRQIIRCIRESDGLISGGGSMLQDTTGLRTIPYYLGVIKLAQWLGKPTFIYSQGMGPIRHTSYYPLIRHIFNRMQYISLRDAASVDLIHKIGVRVKKMDIVSDPVMGLPFTSNMKAAPAKGTFSANSIPVIGISVRLWQKDLLDLEQITEALRMILDQRKVHLRFLPFFPPDDIEASRHVVERLGPEYTDRITIVADAVYPRDMLERVSSCDLMIGMRLHSLIYAASYLIPMIGISYDPKIDHFLQRIDMQAAGSTTDLNPREMADQALYLLDHRAEWVESKIELIEALKNKSQQPAQQICEYLRLKG
jgi:polysaccharide pyruvyl transferase CsaB